MNLGITTNMLVREAMSSPVVSVDENEDIVQVANKMREQKVGAVIVFNTRKIKIMISSSYPWQGLFKLVVKRLTPI